MSSAKVLPTLILIVGAFALLDRFRPRRQMAVRWLALSTVALVAGRICWQLDVAGKFSGPDACLQGHAVWHLLTGLSLAGMYLFYRSETVVNSASPRGVER
jgi:predicted membrane channel-forming protein YqfA (hemolysin III family)